MNLVIICAWGFASKGRTVYFFVMNQVVVTLTMIIIPITIPNLDNGFVIGFSFGEKLTTTCKGIVST